MDVLALQIFDNLGFYSCRIAEFDDSDGYGFEFGQLCRSEPSCSSYDLVLVFFSLLLPDHERLQNALRLEAFASSFRLSSLNRLRGLLGDSARTSIATLRYSVSFCFF